MTDPAWSGTLRVELRWRPADDQSDQESALMIGRFTVGSVFHQGSVFGDCWVFWIDVDGGLDSAIAYPTEAEARAALVDAAIKALGS